MRARPLVLVVILFIGGILLARVAPNALWLLGLSLLAPLALPTPWKRPAIASLLVCLAGFVVYSVRYAVLSQHDLRALFADTDNLVTIRGELLEAPVVRDYPSRTRTNYTSTAPLRVSAVDLNGEWQPAEGVIITSSTGILPAHFRPGAQVEVSGVLRPPPSANAPGLFDYRNYLYHQRIFYQLRADAAEDWQLLQSPALSFTLFTDRFQKWAQAQLARGLPPDQILELIWAMTLGWKTGLDGTVADAFMRTGTMHIFAISGLHVACIAGVLVYALRFCGFTRQHCGWVAIPLLWFYTLATGWQSTAVRSALMSTVLILGWGMKRPTDLLNSTAAAGLLILIFEPEQLFQASFQLSFLVVASMALFLPALESLRARTLAAREDPFLPPELRPRWKQLLDLPLRTVTTSFTVSFASWIGSLPLVAWYFNITTPISLLANLLAVPLSSLALTTSLLSLALPPLGPLFNFLSYAFMWETVVVTHWFAEFDWGYFHVPKPTPTFFLLFYSLLLFLFASRKLTPRLRLAFGAVPVSLALTFLISLVPASRTVQATMIPVDGNPVHFDFPRRSRDLLVDCSSEHGSEYVLKRYLRAQGVGTIANLLVTHGDVNHAGGYELVWREFTPKSIFTSPARARSPVYRRMMAELDRGFLQWTKVQRGDELAGWEVLHPADQSYSRADDNSVVLRSTIHGWTILFLSELGRAGQRELARSGADLQADIVLCGSPEQDEPLEADILATINPRLILVGNTSGFVNATAESRLVTRLRKTGAPVFTTTRHGALSLSLTRGSCTLQTTSGHSVHLQR